MHAPDRPIFKIPFESENLGKSIGFGLAKFSIFVFIDPLN